VATTIERLNDVLATIRLRKEVALLSKRFFKMRGELAFHGLGVVGEYGDKNVFEEIKSRFFADYIYNNVGPILIAINPYKPLNTVGGGHGHTCEASIRNVPINEMANLTLRDLIRRNQSIVISGGNE
jgi:hypothetical protein